MPNALILEGKYDEAIAVCRNKLRRLPHGSSLAHWYHSQLCSAYYEKRNYKVALKWGQLAIKDFPNCPMALWHYAGTLFQLNYIDEAISVYKTIVNRNIKKLASLPCGEGIVRAKGLKSDCRLRLAICYFNKQDIKTANKWCGLFLRYYCRYGIDKKCDGLRLAAKLIP